MKPLNHGFRNPLTEKQMSEVLGYTKSLRDMVNHLKDVTGFDPEKRRVDAVELLESLMATGNQLTKVFETEKANLLNLQKKNT